MNTRFELPAVWQGETPLLCIVRHEETGAPLDRIEIPEIDRENARKALAMMVTLTEQRREKLEAKGSAT